MVQPGADQSGLVHDELSAIPRAELDQVAAAGCDTATLQRD